MAAIMKKLAVFDLQQKQIKINICFDEELRCVIKDVELSVSQKAQFFSTAQNM
jgi:hypothetical protein